MSTPVESSQPMKPWFKRRWGIVLLAILALVLALIAAFAVWVARDVKTINDSYTTAEDQCREEVSNQARYPGGINFVDPPYVNPDTSIENDRGNKIYNMGGAVDFPNVYGTPVRMTYMCLSEFDGNQIVKTSAIVKKEE